MLFLSQVIDRRLARGSRRAGRSLDPTASFYGTKERILCDVLALDLKRPI
jgi:hypothetical protein